MPDYLAKFRGLTADLVTPAESERFLAAAQRLVALSPAEVRGLNPVLPEGTVHPDRPTGAGILDWKRG
jgi:2-methylcitrate dehydratase